MIEVTNIWDYLCNVCITIMEGLSRETGMSYGLINILFFVILGPLATFCFALSTAIQLWLKKQPVKNILTWTFVTIGLISVITIGGLIFYGFVFVPY